MTVRKWNRNRFEFVSQARLLPSSVSQRELLFHSDRETNEETSRELVVPRRGPGVLQHRTAHSCLPGQERTLGFQSLGILVVLNPAMRRRIAVRWALLRRLETSLFKPGQIPNKRATPTTQQTCGGLLGIQLSGTRDQKEFQGLILQASLHQRSVQRALDQGLR